MSGCPRAVADGLVIECFLGSRAACWPKPNALTRLRPVLRGLQRGRMEGLCCEVQHCRMHCFEAISPTS
jgi:hypothetical protein